MIRIIISRHQGIITDVWIDVKEFGTSESRTSLWEFKTSDGKSVSLNSLECKSIEVDEEEAKRYVEYHEELELESYNEKLRDLRKKSQ